MSDMAYEPMLPASITRDSQKCFVGRTAATVFDAGSAADTEDG